MNCPKCNAEIPAGKNFCVECGEHLPAQPEVRKCDKCGAAIPDGKNFCVECGEHLPEETQVRKCVKCGAVIPDGKNFCVECGTPYAAETTTTQAPVGGMTNAGAAASSGPAAPSTSILSGRKWSYIVMAIAWAAILINLAFFLISEFWLPQFSGPLGVIGLFVPAIPLAVVTVCMTSVQTRDGRVVPIMRLSALSKVVFYVGCGLAVVINLFSFVWNSELQLKYSLYSTLKGDEKFSRLVSSSSFQWRQDITRKSDRTYVVKARDFRITFQYEDTLKGKKWKFAKVEDLDPERAGKHQLSKMLDKVFTDRPANEKFSWRKDIVVKDDVYLVPLHKLVRDREDLRGVNLAFKRHYDQSTGKTSFEPADSNTGVWMEYPSGVITLDIDPNDPAVKAFQDAMNADEIEFEKPNLD